MEIIYSDIDNSAKGSITHNRAFLYGDGLFETGRLYGGHLVWGNYHEARLRQSLGLLGLEWPFSDSLEAYLKTLWGGLLPQGAWRWRLSLYRQGAGLYRPAEGASTAVELRAAPLAEALYPLWPQGVYYRAFTCPALRLPINDELSPVKSLSALRYVQAARYLAARPGFQDLILLNSAEALAEAGAANLFLLMPDNEVLTPRLSEGCVAGIMRQVLLDNLPELGYSVQETRVSSQDLKRAQEVWRSSSIQGLQPLHEIEGYTYHDKQALEVQTWLRQQIARS